MSMTYTETLTVTHCWCGIAVAVPETLYQHAQKSSRNEIYCPLGHSFVFRDSWEDKFKREQQEHNATLALLAEEEKRHAKTQTKLRTTVKRIEAGVCPHCHRTFQNVAQHMQSKHPEACEHDAPSADRAASGDLKRRVLDFLADGPHTYSEVRDGLEISSNHAGNILNRMLRADEIMRVSRGVYALP